MFRKLLSCVLALAALCAPLSRQMYAASDAPFALVKDIQTAVQPMHGLPDYVMFVTLGDTILFSANTPQTGNELWRTDGTEAGTTLVKDINPGERQAIGPYGTPSQVLNGALLFAADDGATGSELWRSDGTPAGTTLLKDTWPGTESGYPDNFHLVGNRAFFTTRISETMYAWWSSDGTPAGTALLKSFSGIGDAVVMPPTLYSGAALIFTAAETSGNFELWKSDGTPAGTTLVKDIHAGPTGSSPSHLTEIRPGEWLVFSANDGVNGRELWRTDGTPAGTQLVTNIVAGNGSSNPSGIVPVQASSYIPPTYYGVLFSATDGVNGRELWQSNGFDFTQIVTDAYKGNGSSTPQFMATHTCYYAPNGITRTCPFFTMTDQAHGRELWFADPGLGMVLLKDIYTGTTASSIGNLVKVGETFYFAAANEPTGEELWKTDGTPAGTLQVADIYSGTMPSNPQNLIAFNGKLYFTADDGVRGREMWSSDGTPAGTALLKDVQSGKGSGARRMLGEALGALYFTADDGATGYELWKTDGTPGGTVLVKNIAPDVGGIEVYPGYNLAALGDRLVMGVGSEGYDLSAMSLRSQAGDLIGTETGMEASVDGQAELVLNGVEGPPFQDAHPDDAIATEDLVSQDPLTQPLPQGKRSRTPLPVGEGLGEGAVMQAKDASMSAASTSALWVSDGTNAGTMAIRSFPSIYGEYPYALTTLGDGVLFGGLDNAEVYELWRTDGTPQGTNILGNAVKPYFGSVSELTKLNDLVLMHVYTDTTPEFNNRHYSLWRTDGTPQGTQLVKANVVFGNGGQAASGNTVFFTGYLPDIGNAELWKTDGTEAGTIQVKDIYSGTNGSYPRQITPGAPGNVFFFAYMGSAGYQLWKSDGSEPGTALVHDVRPSDSKYEYDELAFVNGTLFFSANDGVNGWELWKSDGTGPGTALLADLYPGYGSSDPEDLIGLNGALYFSATGPDGRRTLWRSDGTPTGTQPVRSDAGAPLNPYDLTVIQGQLMFSAADDAHGREVWTSDGTPAGTNLTQDVVPGADSSNPQAFIETTRHVWFTADTPGIGRELWAMPLGDVPIPTPTPTPNPTPVPTPPGGHRVHLPLMVR